MKHSPTPWKVDPEPYREGGYYIQTSTQCVAMTCDCPQPEEQQLANAAHICLCVNAHEELVEALQRVLIFDQRISACSVDGGSALIKDIRALLSRLNGGVQE